MRRKRNSHGVIDSSECYRTVNGVQYIAWSSHPSQDRITAYRLAGARVRRYGQELFVHPADEEITKEVDSKYGD